MRDIFPFDKIEKNTKVVLYGASERGYDFYRQIISTGYCQLVLWVDRQAEWYRYMNLPVDEPGEIRNVEYDLILITAEKKSVYESIRDDLLQIDVEEAKIFWQDDCRIKGNCAAEYNHDRIIQESESAFEIKPKDLLQEERLDIVIRYIYAMAFVNNQDFSNSRELYRKLIEVQNGGNEPTENLISGFFSEYERKKGLNLFEKSFQELVVSMQKHGFKKECFVPLDNKGRLINGAHRLASALVCGCDIWARKYIFDGVAFDYGRGWLEQNGFSEDEVNYVLNTYNTFFV